MKRFILVLSLIFGYQTLTADTDSIFVCINPGHGGHETANDRYIPETGIWESETNLAKGLALNEMMKSLGFKTIMTRTQNNDNDDLALSQIVAIANSNNVDFMHAIHSNGWRGTDNYTLMLFQGGDNSPTFTEAKEMALIMANEIYKTNRTTSRTSRGDFDFYGTGQPYLGVFRNLTMPGTLSEGSFHDYIPESWRLWNSDYKINEAYALACSFIQFYHLALPTVGTIAGIVRDSLETVSYYYISGTQDAAKPINHTKITLLPLNLEYYCDSLNNGYFSFSNLIPGAYQLIFHAANYYPETLSVTAKANQIVFADTKLLTDTTITPAILSTSPEKPGDSIKIVAAIKINFDRSMSRVSLDSAMTIQPPITGKKTWSNLDKTLTITPTTPLEIGTHYILTITTQACSKWNVPLKDTFTFQFKTESKSHLQIVKSYPAPQQTEVPLRPQIRLFLDSPVKNSVGNLKKVITVVGPDQQAVEISTTYKSEDDESCFIWFSFTTELSLNTLYTLRIGTDAIKGKYGINLDTTEFTFQTTGQTWNGVVLDSLETIGGWKGPSSTSGSVNIDKTLSTFALSTETRISGINSGKMTYVFTDTLGGICRYYNSKKPNVGNDPNSNMGLWVHGDFSQNILEFWFSGNNSEIIKVVVDTLDWAGWRMVSLPLSRVVIDSNRILQSVTVVQAASGTRSSAIYIDDLQNQLTPVAIDETRPPIQSSFIQLYQNYPNPFNPSTLIRYHLTASAPVNLEIYNLLGEKIKTLLDQHPSPAGLSQYSWDGTDDYDQPVSSGIYFSRLTVNQSSLIRKMSLIK